MKFLIIFALCFTLACARPQQFPGDNNRNSVQQQRNPNNGNNRNPFLPPNNSQNNQVFSTTTPAPSTTSPRTNTPTTATPQYLACLQSCPSTMEYNPICGSDNINYHNNGRLSCAQRCGKNVAALRAGTCNAL